VCERVRGGRNFGGGFGFEKVRRRVAPRGATPCVYASVQRTKSAPWKGFENGFAPGGAAPS
jgi:hypothetical protein